MNTPPPSQWKTLFRIVCEIIDQANARQPVVDHWTFGGGTALMLQIGHRDSHDIDIFVADPQVLPYLNPVTQGYNSEIIPAGYEGDGSRFLKVAFEAKGEIDFIVAPSLTTNATYQGEIDGRMVAIETIPEIITKKLVFRGGSIKPRDIFDIAAASRSSGAEIVCALRDYKQHVGAALTYMNGLNPDFIKSAIQQLAVHHDYIGIIDGSFEMAARLLRSV